MCLSFLFFFSTSNTCGFAEEEEKKGKRSGHAYQLTLATLPGGAPLSTRHSSRQNGIC
jgi:hypothetical protein